MNDGNEWDKLAKILTRALENIAQSMCDDYIKKNAEFRSKAGLKPKIIRRMNRETCEWCRKLAGTYEYGEEPQEVYQRHDNCDCTVEYVTEKGHQDVWTKKWTYERDSEAIESRKALANIDKRKMLSENVEDVTAEYIRKATPGKGKIRIDSGVDYKKNAEDIKIAEWLKHNFGGEIRVVKDVNKYKEGTPDYIWNGMRWELKSPSSKNSIDKRMQKAGHQLGESGGGMVIDVSNAKSLESEDVVNFIVEKLPKRARGNIDLIIVKNEKLIKVIRYEKK